MTKAISAVLTAAFTALSLILGALQTTPPEPSPPVETPAPFDYTSPVPEGDLLGEEWFDDSAVIGHSLMEGFEGFAQVCSNIHYFTATGLSAAGALGYSKFDLPDGGTGTLGEGLDQRQFSKVYIMLGVNEITASPSRFQKNMSKLVDAVRDSQGEDIPIYIVSITPITQKKSDNSLFTRERAQGLNEALQALCADKECYYLDLFSFFADEDGYLPSEISTDGIHLTAAQYPIMADYFKSHTVSED